MSSKLIPPCTEHTPCLPPSFIESLVNNDWRWLFFHESATWYRNVTCANPSSVILTRKIEETVWVVLGRLCPISCENLSVLILPLSLDTGDFIRLFYRAPASAERQFPARTELWEGGRKRGQFISVIAWPRFPLYMCTGWQFGYGWQNLGPRLKISEVGMNTKVYSCL